MNLLCNDMLRLFIHHSKASTVYTLLLSTRKLSHLLTTQRYIEESRRRLATVEKIVVNTHDAKATVWIPLLPNGEVEGVKHAMEESGDVRRYYEISMYHNNERHGLWIGYYLDHVGAKKYTNGINDGFEQWSLYDGTIIQRRTWANGNVVY